jgi:ATP-dependent exoDNAse (exonuclease V) beta subunit
LISKKNEVSEYGLTEAQIFDSEQHKLQLDAFNLLYVTLTRAIDCLYIICPLDIKKDGSYNTDYFSGLFLHFLTQKGIRKEHIYDYSFGDLVNTSSVGNSTNKNFNIPYIYTNRERESFNIITKTGLLWDTDLETALDEGNKIHYILGNIEYQTDIDSAILKGIHKGIIEYNEVDSVRGKVQAVIFHPELKKYFGNTNTVYNERDILLLNGNILRPDRVVIREGKASIIDYKTGDRSQKYHQQINAYADSYLKLGYKIENKIIVYINNTIFTEFI